MHLPAGALNESVKKEQTNSKALETKYTEKIKKHNASLHRSLTFCTHTHLLWPPYGIGQAIIFLPRGFFFYLSFFFFSSPNLSGRRVDVYHTSTHGVALVRI